MSDSLSDEQVEIRVGSSIRFQCLIFLVHSLALLAIWVSALSLFVQTILTLFLLAYGWHVYTLYIKRSRPESVLRLRYKSGVWYLQRADGWRRVWPSGEKLVTSFLISMTFREDGCRQRYFVNLFSDSDRTEALHALRLRLLLEHDHNPGLLEWIKSFLNNSGRK